MKKEIKYTLISTAIGMIVILIMTMLQAALMAKIDSSTAFVTASTMCSMIIGGFIAGYSNALFHKERGIIVGLIVGGVLSIIIISLRLILFPISLEMLSAIKVIVLVIFSILGGIVGVNKRGKKYVK